MAETIAERFDRYCGRDKARRCWLWTGSISPGGYGQMADAPPGRRPLKAHRVAWALFRGPIPDGLFVLHRCDVRACVNPAHLFLGTAKDNILDMETKGRGRHPRGERHVRSKLDAPQVEVIRYLSRNTLLNRKEIADLFGVGRTAILSIESGRTWAWLPDQHCRRLHAQPRLARST